MPRSINTPAIDLIVGELNELQRGAAFEFAYRMGKLIIDRLYGGNLALWRTRATKDASFRKLANRSGRDLKVSASTLFRSVALFELTDRLGVSAVKQLSPTHVCAVFGLPEQQQRRLLSDAAKQAWSAKQLESEAAKLRRGQGRNRGRRPLPGFLKTVHRLASLLSNPDEALGGLDDLAHLNDAEVDRVARILDSASGAIECLRKRVGAQLNGR